MILWLLCVWSVANAGEPQVSFETDVRPIFKAMCFHCHGEDDELAGGLDVRLVRLMRKGGDSGSALDGGDVDDSLLWQRIESDEMPEGPKKLSAEQKQIVRRWIDRGAKTLRPEPDDIHVAKYTVEEISHWAFQPVTKPTRIEEVDNRNPIDHFVAARLRHAGLQPSPRADRAALLRRVTFDLTGLPPTPDELDAFLDAPSDNAYEKIVDRLLASSAFGIRWGRHWLDIAGYSETEGHLSDDVHRQHAWRYRDYVIDSINADKPYDQFLREQLAGDEIVGTIPDGNNDQHVELMTATGFLQMAPDLTSKSDTINDRNQAVAETIKVVSSSILGLSVGCAQCHDHRYDPVSAEDYYSMRAIFDPAFPLHDWLKPDARTLDMTDDDTLAAIAKVESKAVGMQDDLRKAKLRVANEIYSELLQALPENIREKLAEAANIPSDDRTDEETELLDQHPNFGTVETIVEKIAVYDPDKDKEFFEEQKKIDQVLQSGPPRRIVMCVTERPGVVPESQVFSRGDPLSPKQDVEPAEVFVLARARSHVSIPANAKTIPTTGRRLAYARQLTDGTHPTVARVAINRMWANHFGRGLVSTPSDFGIQGEAPSHPDLLDWLADDFVSHGWRMKRMHKMMVMSRTYRQTSRRSTESDAIDPDNRLLSRMTMRRLQAEEIRDAVLSVTGLLDPKMNGPSVPIATRPDGHTVIGKAVLNNGGLFDHVEDVGAEKYRRSIYLSNERISPLTMLNTFDAPIMTPNCDQRTCSTVAPQSLWFLNDALILDVTDKLADRMFAEPFEDAEDRITDLFRRIYSSSPTKAEMASCLEYLQRQADLIRQYDDPQWVANLERWPHAADVAAHATLCQALMSTNRFLYVQ